MKRNWLCSLCCLFFIFSCSVSFSQPIAWSWESNPYGVSYDGAYAVATDNQGNVYQTGYFYGTSIDFDGFILYNIFPGKHDMFIVKYDAAGTVLWANSAGGNNEDSGYSVATDGYGNVYVTGYFYSPSITFGSTTLYNQGEYDMFIVKYDPSGTILWAKRAGRNGDDYGRCVVTDAMNNVYVTGSFQSSTMTFGSTILTNEDLSETTYDMFLVKYDSAGTVLWARSAGGDSIEYARTVAIDALGNSYIAGSSNSLSQVIGSDTLINQGSYDAYIAKYDAAGNALWAKGIGGSDAENASSVATDPNGNIYVCGGFETLSLTLGSTTLTNPALGNFNAMLIKCDSSGGIIWARQADGTGNDYGYDVAADTLGNAYVTGFFESSGLAFDTTVLTNMGMHDVFIAKYDTAGTMCWAKSAGGSDIDYVHSVCTDLSGAVYITGFFQSTTMDFYNPLVNSGGSDAFLAKLEDPLIGIREVPAVAELSLYPNPSCGKIVLKTGINEEGILSLLNIMGQPMLETILFHEKELDLSDLPSGMYLLQFRVGNQIMTKSIIKE